MQNNLRIAIFQYDLPLQSYSRDLAFKLREAGIQVEFFGYKLGERDHVSRDDWVLKEVPLYEFDKQTNQATEKMPSPLSVWKKLKWRWERHRAKQIFGRDLHFLDRCVLLESHKIFVTKTYDLIIGIEKHGLIWGGMMSEVFKIPYLYYSLELYLEDHPMMEHVGHLRKAESLFHRGAAATIVQDSLRAEALRIANKAETTEILIPVAVRGPANREKTQFLHERMGLEGNPVILIFFGGMMESRMCEVIIEAIDYLPDNFCLVFHGYAQDEEYLRHLKKMARGRRVHFSEADLEESEIDLLLASADIGFALYRNDNMNDRLTAFSSQKIALFCRNGLPFLGNRNESYENLFGKYRCGEMASTPEEIAAAVMKISESPLKYQEHCFDAFDDYYDFDQQFSALEDFIKAGEWKISNQ